jgi:hypothetical protein
MRRFRPSPAMVVACIALLVALGGTAMASVIITSNSQVAQGTISGHKPPSGKHPNLISGSVNGQDLSGGLKASLTLHCPSGLTRAADLCFEASTRDSAPYATALKRCAAVNLRLPTDGELALVYEHSGAPQQSQWTASHFENVDALQFYGSWLAMDEGRNLLYGASSVNSAQIYRCVTSPRN